MMRHCTRRGFLAAASTALATQWVAVALPSSAAPPWVDWRSHGPFQVRATFPLKGLKPLFEDLSALEMELERTLAIPPTRQPIEVYLVEDQQTHREFLSQLYPPVPYRRALYVKRNGYGNVYAYHHADLPIDLRHECTHALLHANLPMVPLWLDEGLAEYFEMPEAKRPFDHPHLFKLRWDLRFGMVRSIESMENCRELSEMGAVEYRFAWAWAHFMLHGPLQAHRTLVHYLADIRRGNPPGKLSQRLRQAVPDLEVQMVRHFKHWRR